MNKFVLAKRVEIRSALDKNRQHRLGDVAQPKFTDLGMHFTDVDGTPVLVTVEVNVPRLIATLGKRLAKSKSGMARMANNAVRLSIATAEGREVCAIATAKGAE